MAVRATVVVVAALPRGLAVAIAAEETPQTAPKTATTDDPSSAVFLRTLEPFHSRIVNDRSEWGLNKTFQLLRK